MRLIQPFALLTLALSASLAWAAPKKVALLVGVGTVPSMQVLQGPSHDVLALQDVLVQRWGFAATDVKTLTDKAATRAAITQALQALVQRTQPGDEVFLYLSGHGTSSLQPGFEKAMPDGSGAFFTVDSNARGENLLIGRTDIRPVLEQLDKGGRKVWFVADTCFSGSMARNLMQHSGAKLIPKMSTLIDDSRYAQILSRVRDNLGQQKAGDWPYDHVAFLGASAAGEPALDITKAAAVSILPTVDRNPHGALTDALLRVLDGSLPADVNRDGAYSLQEVYETVSLFMSSRPYGQNPQRFPAFKDDRQGIAQAPLLRGASVSAPSQVYEPTPVRVHVMACFDKDANTARERLRRLPGVTLVDTFDATTPVSLATSRDKQQLLLLSSDGGMINAAPLAQVDLIAGSLHQLVWLSKIEALAKSGRRAVLEAEITPAELGVTRVVGDTLDLSIRPDRDTHLMLLNINALGEVSVVYPYMNDQLQSLPATTVTKLAGFPVELPEGTDVQLWFAFDQMPASLGQQIGRLNLKPGDARLKELERLIGEQKGRYAFARTEFRTYKPETLKRPIAQDVCR